MDIDQKWQKALKKTEILRTRLRHLLTFEHTELPYVFLAESSVNVGDVVVRKGRIMVDKPLIVLPGNFPQFEGFEFKKDFHLDDESVTTFLMMRGVSFPSLKYSNEVTTIDVCPGPLSGAIKRFLNELQKKEDTDCGLIIAPEDCWQFAVIIYAASQVAKSVPEDIKNILRKKKGK